MLYMFLLYADPKAKWPADIMERHLAVYREARARGAYVTSEALGGTAGARTVRVRNGGTRVTDGPFAETKEVLGGFYVLDCRDLDDALAFAAKIPDAGVGAVEVRPVVRVPDWPYADAVPRERHAMTPPA
jgi:hypothetical protein